MSDIVVHTFSDHQVRTLSASNADLLVKQVAGSITGFLDGTYKLPDNRPIAKVQES